ncbi:hypothetical protein [Tenacibaculum sp. M341]|uniref:hypothetical protein n=1 Tax=Tenacibaculum sp. M341 TaxID=2530339 RepID=UPI001053EF4C|nr:hypothetical protein [Tenacibaculum sp. M341]TCI92195.1 hypothetical protein EYW44_08420 [Tenacibaculum sp. M341]
MKKLLIAAIIVFASCKTDNKENQTKQLNKKTEIVEKARKKINDALKLSRQINNEIEIANSLFQLSKLEFSYGVPLIATISLEKAKEIYKPKGLKTKLVELNTFGIALYKKVGNKEKVTELIPEIQSGN